MAYEQKTWVNRVAEHPARRKLTATGAEGVFDVSREEGLVTAAGDAFSAGTMNGLEARIAAGFSEVNSTIENLNPSDIGAATAAQGTLAENALPKAGGALTGQVTAGGTQAIGTAQIRNVYATTTDLVAGTTVLATGTIALVYTTA